jgi:hypothetical protein
MHGMHIIETYEFTDLVVGHKLYITLSADMGSDLVAEVEVLQGGAMSSKPTVAGAVSHSLEGDGTVKLEWAAAAKPAIGTCESIDYTAFYHKMDDMHTGMVMGTYCGTTHTTSGDHDDMHGDDSGGDDHDHDHHGHRLLDHAEDHAMDDATDIHQLVPVHASGTSATIPDLDYSAEYHIEVVAACLDADGEVVSGRSYQPFMLQGGETRSPT